VTGPTYTSLTAYREHVASGKALHQMERVLYALEKQGPMTRADLAVLFSRSRHSDPPSPLDGPPIMLAAICGRVYALRVSGLVRVVMEVKDANTGHLVELLEVEAQGQLPMFREFVDRLKPRPGLAT
jgi:hypothetical protein